MHGFKDKLPLFSFAVGCWIHVVLLLLAATVVRNALSPSTSIIEVFAQSFGFLWILLCMSLLIFEVKAAHALSSYIGKHHSDEWKKYSDQYNGPLSNLRGPWNPWWNYWFSTKDFNDPILKKLRSDVDALLLAWFAMYISIPGVVILVVLASIMVRIIHSLYFG